MRDTMTLPPHATGELLYGLSAVPLAIDPDPQETD